jgi:lipolytic enzyme, G-D-S-L
MSSNHASKRVFIYGDSNVWGDSFVGSRVRYSDRWVNRLKRELRGKARIIADGLSGRVAGDLCKAKPYKNGKQAFTKALQQAGDLDTIIIALGTNDLQQQYNRTAQAIIQDLIEYQKLAHGADVIYILPPAFSTGEDSGPEFTEQSEAIRQEILQNKEALGEYIELPFIPLSDGIHFSAKGHRLVARAVKQALKARQM